MIETYQKIVVIIQYRHTWMSLLIYKEIKNSPFYMVIMYAVNPLLDFRPFRGPTSCAQCHIKSTVTRLCKVNILTGGAIKKSSLLNAYRGLKHPGRRDDQ
jgi:hypothetical protein